MPVGGHGPYLGACLTSLADEARRAMRSGIETDIVIVLDRVTPDVVAEINGWSRELGCVKVVESATPGTPAALNLGIQQCSGEYLARIDSDDVVVAGRFEAQVAALAKDSALVLVGGQVVRLVGDRPDSVSNLPLSHDRIVSRLMAGKHAVNQPSVTVRRSMLERIGGYWDDGPGEDWDLFLKLSNVGRLTNLPQVVTAYRYHAGSTNSRAMVDVREGIELSIVNETRRRRGAAPLRRADLSWRHYPLRKLRARRHGASQQMYRRYLSSRGESASAWGWLGGAAALAPEIAVARLRDDRDGRSRIDSASAVSEPPDR